MELAIFAKKRMTRDNKPFTGYIAKLKNKVTGEEITCGVRFREECGAPKYEDCPMMISVDKRNANLSEKMVVNEDTGDVITSRTLWVNQWKKSGEFVDHSLDDFE